MTTAKAPTVSIILPTYNRARFLPGAIASIRSQTFTDWELIVVDDGSTDETPLLLQRLANEVPQTVKVVRQENCGPSAARNRGIARAIGRFIAFYDSDDVWLPHHLLDCVTGLEENEDVDWVYGSCRVVDSVTGAVVEPDTFRQQGCERPFLRLRYAQRGPLRIITDQLAFGTAVLSGLYCGPQCSVIRTQVFRRLQFDSRCRVGEDQILVNQALASGGRFGYFDRVHVEYRVHDENSSASAVGQSLDRRLRITRDMIAGYERLLADTPLRKAERRAVRRRLSRDKFWLLGYALLWQNGDRHGAMAAFHHGLAQWPWDWRCWKTYAACSVRLLVGQ